ncbi:(+)-neomenthol dehydrogenase-like isoform X2 [Punica granatum]|uniref:(+)-neomenthol dehydrogenase-like isoform X2 n=1 Tax=Punica granatum TaxID=22663 RepID=A0A6P8E723_PUNGR|nr:(+)-neomenthol dehydrogenase-like isoform X2 [Punica granatum]
MTLKRLSEVDRLALIIRNPFSMVEASTLLDMRRHAVVTGANKGIGLEICRQLASKGVTVVLTSRDEKRGLEAVRKLKQEGSAPLPGEVVFQLDILVNDAGISRIVSYFHALQEAVERIGGWPTDDRV